jgi:hypothetical protein
MCCRSCPSFAIEGNKTSILAPAEYQRQTPKQDEKYCSERAFLLSEKIAQPDEFLAPVRTVDVRGNVLPILSIICDRGQ